MDAAIYALEKADAFEQGAPGEDAAYLRAIVIALVELQPEQRTATTDRPEIEDGWYHVELFGHRARHGYVRTVSLAGRSILEIREPAHVITDAEDPIEVSERVENYAASAVFSLTPTDEANVVDTLAERGQGVRF